MRSGAPLSDLLTFGGRTPPVVGGLIVALLGVSLVSHLAGFGGLLVLYAPAVLEGQVWRLFTFPFVDAQPLSLLMGALTLYWFGRDLAWAWGPRRLVVTWLLLGAAAGAVAVAVAVAWPATAGAVHAGPWVVLSGLLVAWGLLHPERQILFNFLLPVSGRGLALVTVGMTVFFAAFEGVAAHVPHFAAEGLVFLWFRGVSARGAWQSLRIWLGQRRMRRRARHLQVVRKDRKGEPPRWLN